MQIKPPTPSFRLPPRAAEGAAATMGQRLLQKKEKGLDKTRGTLYNTQAAKDSRWLFAVNPAEVPQYDMFGVLAFFGRTDTFFISIRR